MLGMSSEKKLRKKILHVNQLMGKVNAKIFLLKNKLQRTERTAFAEQQKAREIPKGQDPDEEDKNRNPTMLEGEMK